MDIVRKDRTVLPERFADVTFHPVPDYCPAYLTRHGQSHLSSLTWPPGKVADKTRPHNLLAVLMHKLKIEFADKVFAARKLLLARHKDSSLSY